MASRQRRNTELNFAHLKTHSGEKFKKCKLDKMNGALMYHEWRASWKAELISAQLKQAMATSAPRLLNSVYIFNNINNLYCQECQSHREPTSVVPTFLLDFTQFKPML